MITTILIAQSNYLVKEGLKSLIISDKSLLLSGEASNGDELSRIALAGKPDVIIIDHLDPAFGISTLRRIISESPSTRFLTISEKPSRWMLADAMSTGITSYLLRDCEKDEILDAVHATAKGEKFFCGKILSSVVKNNGEEISAETISCDGLRISDREAEIISFIAEGLTNKEIADKLFLSTHTITTHRKNIMSKLGVNNTAGLVLFAIKNNIVTPNHFLFNTN
ncbi:MAG: response regulator transcription factor [Bacteroidetes bacterium]|nr:response regulator transcription factor [Bacteroidota bacterium]